MELWRLGAVAGAVLLALPVSAADEPALDAIVITGSRLSGGASQSALPVQVITRQEIERSGVSSTADLLARVSANQPFQTPAMAVGSYGPAAYAGANLRGLGDSNTLVLVNGRRIAQHAATFGTSADLLAIPLAAVERVEILKDGASALYGADAVGGVINFILRQDFQGLDLQLDLAGTSAGGAARQGLSATAGGALGQSDVHWVGSLTWDKERRLSSRQRAATRSAYVPGLMNGLDYGGWPANFTDPRDPQALVSPGACRPPTSVVDPDGSGLCLFDSASTVDLLPQSERTNGYLRVEGRAWDATSRWFAEGMASRVVQQVTSTPGWVAGFDPSTGLYGYPSLPTTSPYYPSDWAAANGVTPTDLTIDYWRLADQGPRVDRHVGGQQRWLLGLQAQNGGWQWDSALTFTRHRLVSSMASGYYRYSDLAAMTADGSLNPFGAQTAATQARLDALAVRDPYAWMETRTRGIDVKASRAVGTLPGGEARLALGGEARLERLVNDYSQDALDCTISGGLCGGFDLQSQRTVKAAFGELLLPFWPDWSAQLALRHDRYSAGGSATTPKAALKWRMSSDVSWRASAGRGFIAPSLEQLYAPQTFGFAPGSGLSDAVLCPQDGLPYNCGLQGFNQRTGGNPALSPETSRQWNIGVVFGGGPRWQASVDLWAVRKRNRIGFVPAGTVFADQSVYESLGYLTRYGAGDALPDNTTCVNGVCPIQYVDATYRNLGQQKTSGVDLASQWRSRPGRWGTWTAGLEGTWVQQFKTQLTSIGPFVEQAGRYALDRPVPRWRHLLQAGLESGAWQWGVAHRFVASYVDFNPDPSVYADRRVRPQSLWDVQAAYRWSEQVMLSLSVLNAFDVSPPASRQVNSFQAGYDPHFADPRGRIVALRTRWQL